MNQWQNQRNGFRSNDHVVHRIALSWRIQDLSQARKRKKDTYMYSRPLLGWIRHRIKTPTFRKQRPLSLLNLIISPLISPPIEFIVENALTNRLLHTRLKQNQKQLASPSQILFIKKKLVLALFITEILNFKTLFVTRWSLNTTYGHKLTLLDVILSYSVVTPPPSIIAMNATRSRCLYESWFNYRVNGRPTEIVDQAVSLSNILHTYFLFDRQPIALGQTPLHRYM